MSDRVTRYPLSWPAGWKRNGNARQRAAFGRGVTRTNQFGSSWRQRESLTVSQAIDRLDAELSRLGARDIVLSTNLQLRLDGWPRSGQAEPTDPGAAAYFTLKGKDRCLACDRWLRVADNIAAIAAHVSALRGIDRWGVGTVEQAFTGYAALPEPAEADQWWRVLNVAPSATLDQVDEAFRARALDVHPDRGGSHDEMVRLTAARDAARVAIGGAR